MLKGLTHIVQSSFNQTVLYPLRLKKYESETSGFVHKTPAELIFELQPNDYIDRIIAIEGIFERRFLSFLKTILKPDTVMLDIGANIGNHAIYLANTCERIHCFEPNPVAAERLRRNISLNKLSCKISVHQFGLGIRNEVLPFVENLKGNLGASHFARTANDSAGRAVKRLEVRQAYEAIAELNLEKIDYIKVDVEGMEEAVLTALEPIITKYRPLVTFEHHEHLVAEGTFDRICRSFSGYKMLHPVFAPNQGTVTQKLAWNLRHDGGPVLTEINRPELKTYDNIIAMP